MLNIAENFIDEDGHPKEENILHFIIENIDYGLRAKFYKAVDGFCVGYSPMPDIQKVRNALREIMQLGPVAQIEVGRITHRVFAFEVKMSNRHVPTWAFSTIKTFIEYAKGAKWFSRTKYEDALFLNEYSVTFFIDLDLWVSWFGQFNRCFPVESEISYGQYNLTPKSELELV